MLETAHQAKAYDSVIIRSGEREQLILEHLPQIKYIAQRISTKLPSHVELPPIGRGLKLVRCGDDEVIPRLRHGHRNDSTSFAFSSSSDTGRGT